MSNYVYKSDNDIIKKHALNRAERIKDLYLLNKLNSDVYWEGYDWHSLPEKYVLDMAYSFYNMKRNESKDMFTHEELFHEIGSSKLGFDYKKRKYSGLADCIYSICNTMQERDMTSVFDFSNNNFTLSHVMAIVSDVRDQHQYSYPYGNIDTDHKANREKEASDKYKKDYGRLWVRVIIIGAIGLLFMMIHPGLGILALIIGILFSIKFFDELDV